MSGSHENEVWVDDYTTSTGTHVSGHWRKRTHRGGSAATESETAEASAVSVSHGPTIVGRRGGRLVNPEGELNVIAVSRRVDISGQDASSPDQRLQAGLHVLRQRRAATTPATGAPTLSEAAQRSNDYCASHLRDVDAAAAQRYVPGMALQAKSGATYTATHISSEGLVTMSSGHQFRAADLTRTIQSDAESTQCPSCGQFQGPGHTCPEVGGFAEDDVVQIGNGSTRWQVGGVGPGGNLTLVHPESGRRRFLSPQDPEYATLTRLNQGPPTGVATGLEALRRRRQALSNPPAEVSAGDQSNQHQCPSCGQFAGEGHTCPASPEEDRDRPTYSSIPTSEQRTIINTLIDHENRCGAKGLSLHTEDMAEALGYDLDVADEREETRRVLADMVDRGALIHRGDDLGYSLTPSGRDGRIQAPASSHRCPTCGQYRSDHDGHVCPTSSEATVEVPEGLPDGNYADLKGEERTKQMLADLQTSVAAIVQSGQLGRWLDAMASNGLNRWSFNNRLLSVLQVLQRNPNAELHLMGFRQWEKYNRSVTKGEKAVWILAPMTRKIREEDDNGKTRERTIVTGFKSVPVFNIDQTHGDPMPSSIVNHAPGEATPGTLEGLRDRVGQAGYSYEETEIPDYRGGNGTLGYTDPKTKKIVVDSRLNSAQKASTIAHELGHVHCGHVDGDYSEYVQHRGRMETEAEMTAYMVNRARGMSRSQADSFSPGYIAGWSRGKPEVITDAMERATKSFNKIMDGPWSSNSTKE